MGTASADGPVEPSTSSSTLEDLNALNASLIVLNECIPRQETLQSRAGLARPSEGPGISLNFQVGATEARLQTTLRVPIRLLLVF